MGCIYLSIKFYRSDDIKNQQIKKVSFLTMENRQQLCMVCRKKDVETKVDGVF